MTGPVDIVHVTRGGIVDVVHRGSIVVVDLDGDILFAAGDPDKVAFMRSSAKPIQALPMLLSGAAERFFLEEQEIAIICGSHSGGPEQVRTVAGILKKLGLGVSDLACGQGIKDNCSGKHAGMLALARHRGWPIENYFDPSHPVQREVTSVLSTLCGIDEDDIVFGLDGCGLRTPAMPLKNMALGFARLANPTALPEEYRSPCELIARAMYAHPEMVGGLDFQRIGEMKFVAKGGALGCYCAGAIGERLGFAMKTEDGSSTASANVFFEVMRSLNVATDEEVEKMREQSPPVVKNRKGETTGEILVVV